MWKEPTFGPDDPLPSEKEIKQVLDWYKRKAKARFLADENMPPRAIALVRKMGARVRTAMEAGLLGHPDRSYTAYARKHGLILLTCDRDYLNETAFPLIRCPGIVVCHFGNSTTAHMRATLHCLETILTFPQPYDIWVKIDATPTGWTTSMRHLDGTTSRERRRIHNGRLEIWSE